MLFIFHWKKKKMLSFHQKPMLFCMLASLPRQVEHNNHLIVGGVSDPASRDHQTTDPTPPSPSPGALLHPSLPTSSFCIDPRIPSTIVAGRTLAPRPVVTPSPGCLALYAPCPRVTPGLGSISQRYTYVYLGVEMGLVTYVGQLIASR